ncbi:MAG: DUF1501 domain-containing protein [Pirellulales bacterium]
MLTLSDTRPDRNCQGLARRDFLRVGALGLGALGLGGMDLPGWLAARAVAAESGQRVSLVRDKSVVLLFLQGGPSHIEFFDPKMSAPSEIRAQFGEVATDLPGITFGGHFSRLARLTKHFSIVRSYGSNNSGHTYQEVVSGGNKLKASMSAVYARVAGTNHPTLGTPRNTLVLPEAVEAGLKLRGNFETSALPTLTDPGSLPAHYRAFDPQGGGEIKQNMQLTLPRERFDDRRSLLSGLDQMRRRLDASGQFEGVGKYQQQAFDVIARGVAAAFDLTQESPATLARYDTSHLFNNAEAQRWNDMHRSTNLLGKQMLLARRLCEAGCGFVTVSDCGWDMHANGNSPKYMGGMEWLAPQVDHAVAAFIEDVHERGLQDKILLAVTGEMGRTPRINRDGGRDHYGELTPLLLSGGGLKMGQIVGESDSQAGRAIGMPYRPHHLLATVLHTLLDASELRVTRGLPREIVRIIEDHQPIAELA